MGEFADGYESGLWGSDGIPYDDGYDDYENNDRITNKNKSEKISIELTPTKYLNSESRYLRAKLMNNELNISDIELEVLHDKYNENDLSALEVYCNKIMIGYIQKYNNSTNINDFCFINNEKIRNLILEWRDNNFYLSRSLSNEEETKIQEREEEVKREEELKQKKVKEQHQREEEKLKQQKIKKELKQKKEQERKREDETKKEQERWSDVYDNVKDNTTLTESIKKAFGKDIQGDQSDRMMKKYKDLESIDKPNAIYSTIDFFGGDSEKIRQELKEDILNEEEDPIKEVFYKLFSLALIIFLIYAFMQ